MDFQSRSTEHYYFCFAGHRSSSKYCEDAGFVCDAPFHKSFTAIFECKRDSQCPNDHKCCDQKCFQHKICVLTKESAVNDGSCESWPYNCPYPYPYTFSHRFRCVHDKQCPSDYKCCNQNCFVHKICAKRSPTGKQHQQLPVEEIQLKPSSTSTTTSSWFNIFDRNTEQIEKNTEQKLIEENKVEESTDGTDDLENESNTQLTSEKTEERQIFTEMSVKTTTENSESETTEAKENTSENIITENSYNEITTTLKGEDEDEEYEDNNDENVGTGDDKVTDQIKTTEPTSTLPQISEIEGQVTVNIVTMDPNEIQSILNKGTRTSIFDEDSTSTQNPEYQDYYEEYGDNEKEADNDDDDEYYT